jgi:hypothetical protein
MRSTSALHHLSITTAPLSCGRLASLPPPLSFPISLSFSPFLSLPSSLLFSACLPPSPFLYISTSLPPIIPLPLSLFPSTSPSISHWRNISTPDRLRFRLSISTSAITGLPAFLSPVSVSLVALVPILSARGRDALPLPRS